MRLNIVKDILQGAILRSKFITQLRVAVRVKAPRRVRLCPGFFEAALTDPPLALGSSSLVVKSGSLAGNGWIVQGGEGGWQTYKGGLGNLGCTAADYPETRAEQHSKFIK